MKKQLLSILIASAMLFTALPLASCGSKEPEPEKSRVDHVYKAKELELGEDISPSMLVNTPSGVVVLAREVLDRENYAAQSVILNIDAATGEFSKAVVTLDGENDNVQQIAAAADRSILLLIHSYDENSQKSFFKLGRMSDGKMEIVSDDVGSLFESTGEDSIFGGRSFYINNFTADGDGNIYINCNYAIVALDPDMNKLFELEVSGYIRTLGATSDGRVYASFRDNESGKNQICYIDAEKKQFGDPVPLPESKNILNASFYVGDGYDIYYKDSISLYGFNAADAEPTELLNFINSDINPNSVRSLAIIDAETMVCYCYDYMSGASQELLLLKHIPDDEVPERYVIKLACVFNGDGLLESGAVRFNRASDEYRVELIDYTKYSTDDDYYGEKQLESELLTEAAPDVVLLSTFDKSSDWIAQGAFADLKNLMEKDESFDRSQYFSSLLDEYTNEKGEQFEFVTLFELSTILANRAFLDFDHWDAKKFIEFASSLPSDKYLCSDMEREMLIYLALACSLDSFIDYKNATCSFDSAEFRQLLELAKNTPEFFSYYSTLSGDDLADYREDQSKPFRNGKIVLDPNGGYIYSLDSYAQASVRYGEDAEVVFVGYPSSNGNGTVIRPRMSFGITKNSPVKQGAWEFIKFMSTVKSARSSFTSGINANIGIFDESCESVLGSWYFFRSNGASGFGKDRTREEVMEELEKRWQRTGKENGTLKQITEDDVSALKELINGAQALPDLESKVFEIINEEAAIYFSDAKSLDETVKIIQDRISTYISEIS